MMGGACVDGGAGFLGKKELSGQPPGRHWGHAPSLLAPLPGQTSLCLVLVCYTPLRLLMNAASAESVLDPAVDVMRPVVKRYVAEL